MKKSSVRREALPISSGRSERFVFTALSPKQGRAVAGAPEEPVLQTAEIQGNILAGFNKDHQSFLFLKILDSAAAKEWLQELIPRISSVDEVLAFNRLYRALRARQRSDPPNMAATWVNIAFTAEGLAKLTSQAEVNRFEDGPFREGLASSSSRLGDPTDPKSEGHPNNWLVGGIKNPVDILVIIASDDPAHLQAEVKRILTQINFSKVGRRRGSRGQGLEVVYEQRGMTRADDPGHEHFGFKDGISQPGVRGRVSSDPHNFLTPRYLDPNDPLASNYAKPGQALVWPGQFVLGYPQQRNDDNLNPLEPSPTSPRWACNGSYLVFRRLRQDVAAFRDFMRATAKKLGRTPQFAGMTPERLGAMCVGRWASGAPIMRTPEQDNQVLAGDDMSNNDFRFQDPTPPFSLLPPWRAGNFPPAPGDPDGRICPHAAHIRKVNPRDQATDQGGSNDTLTRMILRRGIPFGESFDRSTKRKAGASNADRGLCFVCYQASIERQFEFLTRTWANRTDKPNDGGHDPIIGQNPKPGEDRARSMNLVPSGGDPQTIGFPREWIIPTGGGYFFSPSVTALKDVLSR